MRVPRTDGEIQILNTLLQEYEVYLVVLSTRDPAKRASSQPVVEPTFQGFMAWLRRSLPSERAREGVERDGEGIA